MLAQHVRQSVQQGQTQLPRLPLHVFRVQGPSEQPLPWVPPRRPPSQGRHLSASRHGAAGQRGALVLLADGGLCGQRRPHRCCRSHFHRCLVEKPSWRQARLRGAAGWRGGRHHAYGRRPLRVQRRGLNPWCHQKQDIC